MHSEGFSKAKVLVGGQRSYVQNLCLLLISCSDSKNILNICPLQCDDMQSKVSVTPHHRGRSKVTHTDLVYACSLMTRPRGYKTRVQFQTQNKAQ